MKMGKLWACDSPWIIPGETVVKNFLFSLSFGGLEPILYELILQQQSIKPAKSYSDF